VDAVISPALAAALERGRDSFNARWHLRRGARRAEGAVEEFLGVLGPNLDPAVAAVAAAAPARTDAACSALFDAALTLWTAGALGTDPDTDAGACVFQRALPALAPVLAAEPVAVAGSLGNALLELRREGIVDPAAWAADVAAVAPSVADVSSLRAAGVVLAWTRGLAHARDAALASLSALPSPLVDAIGVQCRAPSAPADEVRRRLADRWRPRGAAGAGPQRLEIVGYAGAHEAFGGPFRTPPAVRAEDGHLLAVEGERAWRIHADAFGAVLRPSAAAEAPAPARDDDAVRVTDEGEVRWKGFRCRFAELDGASSFAVAADTLAIACADSHRVRLVALVGGMP
jgi:hypothetical protein